MANNLPVSIPSWVSKVRKDQKAIETADEVKKASSVAAKKRIKAEMAKDAVASQPEVISLADVTPSKNVVKNSSIKESAQEALEANMSVAKEKLATADPSKAFTTLNDKFDDVFNDLEAVKKSIRRGAVKPDDVEKLRSAQRVLANLNKPETAQALSKMTPQEVEAITARIGNLTTKHKAIITEGAPQLRSVMSRISEAPAVAEAVAPPSRVMVTAEAAAESVAKAAPPPIRPVGLQQAIAVDKAKQTVSAASVASKTEPVTVESLSIAPWTKTPGSPVWSPKLGAMGDISEVVDDPITGKRYGKVLAKGGKASFVELGDTPASAVLSNTPRPANIGGGGVLKRVPEGMEIVPFKAKASVIPEGMEIVKYSPPVARTGVEAAAAVTARAVGKETLGWQAKRLAFKYLGKNVLKALPVVGEVLAAADIAHTGWDALVTQEDERSKQRALDAFQAVDQLDFSTQAASEEMLSRELDRLGKTQDTLSHIADLSRIKNEVLLNQVLEGRQRSVGRIAMRTPPTADELMAAMGA